MIDKTKIILDDDLTTLDDLDFKYESDYVYNGRCIPRVTKILAACRNQEFLIDYAARMAYQKYIMYRDTALDVGTNVHNMIDEYLMDKYIRRIVITDLNKYYKMINASFTDKQIKQCMVSFDNFIFWEQSLQNLGVQIEAVHAIEHTCACPWFAGTLDAIFQINGAYYIIDFKTSKRISYEYPIQASAYAWMINNGYDNIVPRIDGIGIIRCDKNTPGVLDDLFLNHFVPAQNQMLIDYQNTFASYVQSYYLSAYTDNKTKQYIDDYNRNVLKETK